MGIIKRLFKIIMIVLVLLFIAISLFLLTFDLNSYKGIITSKASEALGRTVTIDKMSMKLSFIPTVALEGIQIDNPKEFEAKRPLLKIDSMDVTLALMPLLKGNIELKEFNLSSATLALVERNNQNNWTFEGGTTKTAQTAQKQKTTQNEHLLDRLRVDNISVKNLFVSYTQNEKTQSVALMNVSVQQLQLVNMT
ncbi:MAG: AsmA family protein, partial [Alphaproteobacteria bacterium]